MSAASVLAVRTERPAQAPLPASRTWNTINDLSGARPDNPVTALLLDAAPSVQKLSLHNQMTLILQAGRQRIVLRDIDTELGWARRGRRPKPGQDELRVIRPHHQAHRLSGNCEFLASPRWEFTQTEPLGGRVRTQTAPEAAGDPATLAEHLIRQLGEHRYRILPGPKTVIDHDVRRITIETDIWHNAPTDAVRLLVPALAHALISDAGHPRGGRALARAS
jgi:hypothetical protein